MKATLKLVGVDLPRAKIKRLPYVTAVAIGQTATGSRVPLRLLPLTGIAGDSPEEPWTIKGEAQHVSAVKTTPKTTGPGYTLDLAGLLPIVLYEGDPGDWLVVSGAVMESDGGHVQAGARIDAARHLVDGTSLGAALAGGLVHRVGPTAGLVLDALKQASQILATNGDDVLCEFEVRIEGEEGFRKHVQEFTVESRSCIVRLSLEVEDDRAKAERSIQALAAARENLDQAIERASGSPTIAAHGGENVLRKSPTGHGKTRATAGEIPQSAEPVIPSAPTPTPRAAAEEVA